MAAGDCGAVVHFNPTATCADTVSCDHAGGARFPVGTTAVTCTASNVQRARQCTFRVTVADTQNPTISCPGDVAVPVVGATSVAVPFAVTASDPCLPVNLVCNPSTGACLNIDERKNCADSRRICTNGSCQSPCGEECVEYCYRDLDSLDPFDTFCCPADAAKFSSVASDGPRFTCCPPGQQHVGGFDNPEMCCSFPNSTVGIGSCDNNSCVCSFQRTGRCC